MTVLRGVFRLRGEGRGWTLLAIAMGWVFVVGGRFLIPAVLPQVKTTFGVSDFGAGVAITVIWATYGLMQSPAGLLVDRFGERKLLTGSLLLTATSIFVLGVAPAFLAFLVGCATFGLATGLYGPARGTALSRTFQNNDGTAIGTTLAAGSVGSAVLPFLAGALVGTYGWRLVIGGLCPLLLLAGVLVWWMVPVSGGGAIPTSSRGLIDDVGRAVRTRGVPTAVLGATLTLFAFQGLTAFLVTYFISSKGFDQTTAAASFSLLFIGAAFSQLASGSLADRFGHRPVLVSVTALNVPLLLMVPFVDGVIPVALLSLLVGTQLGVAPVSNAYVIAVLPERVTGTAWGTLRTGIFIMAAAGSTMVGAMADAGRFSQSFFILAALVAVASVLYTRLPSNAAI